MSSRPAWTTESSRTAMVTERSPILKNKIKTNKQNQQQQKPIMFYLNKAGWGLNPSTKTKAKKSLALLSASFHKQRNRGH